jgi:hypothetical protein
VTGFDASGCVFVGPSGGANVVYDRIGNRPFGTAGVAVRFKPNQNSWWRPKCQHSTSYELLLDYTLSVMPYVSLRAPGDVGIEAASSVLYSRFTATLLPSFAVRDTLELGLTPLAVGFGEPVSSGDTNKVGSAQAYYAPLVMLRFILNHAFALELAAHAALFEKMYGYTSVTIRSAPFRTEYQTATVFLDAGLRWWMF